MNWKYLDRFLDYLLMIILSAMALVVSSNVFFRFVLNSSIYWADELAQVLLVWLTFIGAAVATREKAHYSLSYFIENMKGSKRRVFRIIRDIITLIIVLLLLYYSAKVSFQIESWIIPALEISRSLVYGAVPLGCSFMALYGIRNLIKDLKSKDF